MDVYLQKKGGKIEVWMLWQRRDECFDKEKEHPLCFRELYKG